MHFSIKDSRAKRFTFLDEKQYLEDIKRKVKKSFIYDINEKY